MTERGFRVHRYNKSLGHTLPTRLRQQSSACESLLEMTAARRHEESLVTEL